MMIPKRTIHRKTAVERRTTCNGTPWPELRLGTLDLQQAAL